MRTKKLFVVASCFTILGLLTASCSPAPAATPAPATTKLSGKPTAPTLTTKPGAEQPKYGGVLNRSIRSDSPHYDIHLGSAQIYLAPISPAYNGLVQYDPFDPGRVAADLAEKWTISADGLTYTLDLRKGVKWHDGTAFSSADVPLSIERLKKQGHVGPGLVAIKTVETPNDATAKITMSYPSPSLPKFLSLAWGVIMPKHILDSKGNMRNDVVGTGAFKLKRHERGSFIELEKNPGYWETGRPYLDGVRTYFIADDASAIAALRTGRVDVIIMPRDRTAEVIKESYKEGTVAQYRKDQWRSLYLPIDRAPWSDIRVRKAVHLAIDRQAAIKIVMGGNAELGGIIPEALGGIPAEELLGRPGYRQPKDQDITEARKLLADAGFASGIKTSVLYRKDTEHENQAVFIQKELAKVGIEVALRTLDDASLYDLRTKRTYDSIITGGAMAVREPDYILMNEWRTGGTDNLSIISDPNLDRLIDLQSREQDAEKRKVMVRQISEKIEDTHAAIVLGWGGYWRAWGPRLKNYILPGQLHDGEKAVHLWLAW
ncbi:MAG: ABC transporter substrate-binding protein [Chloroflexi bacterium]|nr:ABC transporter substrate-binding protein [Chloroflexota bacterium]